MCKRGPPKFGNNYTKWGLHNFVLLATTGPNIGAGVLVGGGWLGNHNDEPFSANVYQIRLHETGGASKSNTISLKV